MDKKTCFRWGLTAFLTVAALMVFYDTVFRNGILFTLLHILSKALSPVIYGAVMAYLLAPTVDFFDRCILALTGGKGNRNLVRAGSILLTWTIVFFAFYIFFSILIPQLYQSVVTLIGNMQGYYNTVYRWVMQLLEKNPRFAEVVTETINDYWDELRKWFTNTFLPQAQQTITIVTSGVLSVFVFFKDFFIGVIVSVYVLALKERFARSSRRLLYSRVSEDKYRFAMRAVDKVDKIFSGFVRGKLLDSIIIGVLCFIGSSILRFPYTPLVSVVVGVTNIIPFFGPFLGAIPCALLILLVNPLKCLYFVIFILVLQQLDGNVIGPKILGGSTELPSFWVIVAILIGGGFFNVAGMFLGVPIFACLYAAVRHFCRKRLNKRFAADPTLTEDIFESNNAVEKLRRSETNDKQGEKT